MNQGDAGYTAIGNVQFRSMVEPELSVESTVVGGTVVTTLSVESEGTVVIELTATMGSTEV